MASSSWREASEWADLRLDRISSTLEEEGEIVDAEKPISVSEFVGEAMVKLTRTYATPTGARITLSMERLLRDTDI